VYTTLAQREMLSRAATIAGVPLSVFLRRAAIEHAGDVIAAHARAAALHSTGGNHDGKT
jgi:uncharacterized protein (DUF1778 family)